MTVGNLEVAERISEVLRQRGLLPTQARYRYWESPDGWRFVYTTEKVEDSRGRERWESAVYMPKGPGARSGPRYWTNRTRLVVRSERFHSTRRAARERAYKMYRDHIMVLDGRRLMAAQKEGAAQ